LNLRISLRYNIYLRTTVLQAKLRVRAMDWYDIMIELSPPVPASPRRRLEVAADVANLVRPLPAENLYALRHPPVDDEDYDFVHSQQKVTYGK
jgi:hypothetical protein